MPSTTGLPPDHRQRRRFLPSRAVVAVERQAKRSRQHGESSARAVDIERRETKSGKPCWRVRWRPAGRGGPRESRTFDREGDATAFAVDIQLRARLGHLAGIDSGKVTLDSYVSETWISVYAPQLAENTRRTYRGLYVSHVAPFLGECALRDLTPQAIARWQADRLRRGAGPSGVVKALVLLGSIPETACEAEHIATPARGALGALCRAAARSQCAADRGHLRSRGRRARPRTEARGGRRDPAGAQRAACGASGVDRIVGVMSASGSYDTLPSNCGRGATMGPSGCSAQSSPVVFRARCCACLQGLSSSWDDWRRQKVFLIRKRSQVRVLDRPLAGIQEFAAFTQFSGIWLLEDRCGLGAPRGHMGPPAVTCDAKKRSWVRAAKASAPDSQNAIRRVLRELADERGTFASAVGGPAERHRPPRARVERRRLRDRGRDAIA